MLQGLDHAIALGTEGSNKHGIFRFLTFDSKTISMLSALWHFL